MRFSVIAFVEIVEKLFFDRFFLITLLADCKPQPDPTMSMQCAVFAVDKRGFTFPPYKGEIEAGCDEAVANYRSTFYDEMRKFFTCDSMPEDQIKCIIDHVKPLDFDVYHMVSVIGAALFDKHKLDEGYTDILEGIIEKNNKIVDTVFPKCTGGAMKKKGKRNFGLNYLLTK